jgi:hypothetical protein
MNGTLIAALVSAGAAIIAALIAGCTARRVAKLSQESASKQDLARYHREVVMGPHFDQMRSLIADIYADFEIIERGHYWEFVQTVPKMARLAEHFGAVAQDSEGDVASSIAVEVQAAGRKMSQFDDLLRSWGSVWGRLPELPGSKRAWLEAEVPKVVTMIDACRALLRQAEANISSLRTWVTAQQVECAPPRLDAFTAAADGVRNLTLPEVNDYPPAS